MAARSAHDDDLDAHDARQHEADEADDDILVPAVSVPDPAEAEFDALLPEEIRRHSRIHFTPTAVARRAAELLAPLGTEWVLDVGSGPGKLCTLAARARPGALFVGIEQRRALARLATTIADRLDVANALFLHGDVTDVDWARFDAFYLYNPFAEHIPQRVSCIDDKVELDPEHYDACVAHVEEQLARARVGTRVVTYHGFGGSIPFGYDLALDEEAGTDRLELWIKVYDERAAG